MSDDPQGLVADIIFGRWRSQTLYAAVKLGLIETLSSSEAKPIATVAEEAQVDRDMAYRLLRALSSIGIVQEVPPPDDSGSSRRQASQFLLTDAGCLLRKDNPNSMVDVLLLEEGTDHYAIWKHLPDMVKDGKQNAFVREYGKMAFDHAASNHEYDSVFNGAMTSFSKTQTENVFYALRDYDFSSVTTACDVAGGHGYLLSYFLKENPHVKQGIVVDLPIVIQSEDRHLAKSMGVEDRCIYVEGDMFKEVPTADVYFLKMILHDWNDDECIQILANIRKASSPNTKLFICEHVIPRPNQPGFGNLFDVHMACWGTGRERTANEYKNLLEAARWKYVKWYEPEGGRPMSVVEATF